MSPPLRPFRPPFASLLFAILALVLPFAGAPAQAQGQAGVRTHAAQRHEGHRQGRPPRSHRRAPGAVPGRLDRRGQWPHRRGACARTYDVQGYEEDRPGRVLAPRRRARRPRERVHVARLHRLLPADRRAALERDDAARGRPHGQSAPHRRRVRQGNPRRHGRAPLAHRGSRAIAGLRAVDGQRVRDFAVPHANRRLDERSRIDEGR